jgi:hypothetical protein
MVRVKCRDHVVLFGIKKSWRSSRSASSLAILGVIFLVNPLLSPASSKHSTQLVEILQTNAQPAR